MASPPFSHGLGLHPRLIAVAALSCLWGCEGQGSYPDHGISMLEQPGCSIAEAPCDQARVCTERVCNGVGWTCSWIPSEKDYQWSRKGACEDDGDNCTEELCLDGLCVHLPKTCELSTDPCSENVCQGGDCDSRKIECTNLPPELFKDCDCLVSCKSNRGDCDGDPGNGCETTLDLPNHCGQCDNVCPDAPNATPGCEQPKPGSPFKCTLTCQGPYQDCDKDMSNGCEVPVAVPNSCNAEGIPTVSSSTHIPCGTAYCGSTTSAAAFKFPHFYCQICDNCHYFAQTQISWCNWSTGEFYWPPQDSYCDSSYLDQVCPAEDS